MSLESIMDLPTAPGSRVFAPLDHVDDPDAFRLEVRAWLEAVVPSDWMARMRGPSEEDFRSFQNWWLAELQRVGLATCHWPREWGGADVPLSLRAVVFEEMARARAPGPDLFVVSLNHLPATLFAHGTQAQRERYLGGIKNGREIWCQGFSEPNAGSDLASLRTSAVRDGDAYVINGQKIWSSYGMFADFCLLLVRTDAKPVRKHEGISYVILDMRSPGVTVRPIRQMTGRAEFAEIFLDDVRVPVANLIGAEHTGWSIAQSTLSAERGLLIFEMTERMAGRMEIELSTACRADSSWFHDDQYRREFMRMHAQLHAVRLLVRRMLGEIEAAPASGGMVTATYVKLTWAQTLQAYTELMQRAGVAGMQAMQAPIHGGGHVTGDYVHDFLMSYSWTIAGGSNEIMRNLIAERFLALPK